MPTYFFRITFASGGGETQCPLLCTHMTFSHQIGWLAVAAPLLPPPLHGHLLPRDQIHSQVIRTIMPSRITFHKKMAQ